MKIGLFGYPLSFSLAPKLFAKISEEANVQLKTVLFPTSDIDSLLETLDSKDIRVASILSPLKGEIVKHLDYVDDDARRFDAADWIRREDSILVGGLAARGAILGFFDEHKDKVENCDVAAIAGYGVAATAAIDVLSELGLRRFLIVSNKPERAHANVRRLLEMGFDVEVWHERIGEITEDLSGDIFINATPVGRWLNSDELVIPPKVIKNFRYVLDMNYRPHPTRLVKEAISLSIPADTGLEIFLRKSLLQVEAWISLKLWDRFNELLSFLKGEAEG